jgi:soluble lytic murein transglycosylase-like protein
VPWLPASVARYAPLIDEASFRHGVDANLIAIVMLVESGGDPNAFSPAGATGLMQVKPDTARDIASQRGIAFHTDLRLFEPAYNIDFGTWYLARQLSTFGNGNGQQTIERAAGAYNAGPGRFARHLTTREPLPAETVRYQRFVGGMWAERFAPMSPTFDGWWHDGGGRMVARGNAAPPPILAGVPLPQG